MLRTPEQAPRLNRRMGKRVPVRLQRAMALGPGLAPEKESLVASTPETSQKNMAKEEPAQDTGRREWERPRRNATVKTQSCNLDDDEAELWSFSPTFGTPPPSAMPGAGKRARDRRRLGVTSAQTCAVKQFHEISSVLELLPRFACCDSRPSDEAFAEEVLRQIAELKAFLAVDKSGQDRFIFHVKAKESRVGLHDTIKRALTQVGGWLEMEDDCGTAWNLLWTYRRNKKFLDDVPSLNIFQKVNHFSMSTVLTGKDLLKDTLTPYKRIFNILPATFNLPRDWKSFQREWHRVEEGCREPNLWIAKPSRGACGRGIRVFRHLKDIQPYAKNVVVQKYIHPPLLLHGKYKFDLRIYVLVTSLKPLEAFIYTDGLVRTCSQPYNIDMHDLSNKFQHLTNTSVQKERQSGTAVTKLSLKALWKIMRKDGVDCKSMWEGVIGIVLKSLLCVSLHPSIQHEPNAFEIFGYDIMFDADYTPWLVEVNSSPALSCDGEVDDTVKLGMLYDAIRIIKPVQFSRKALLEFLESLVVGGGTRCRRTTTAELQAKLAEIVHPDELSKDRELGGFQQIVPSPAFDHVLDEYSNRDKQAHKTRH